MKDRLKYIDGIKGIACILVMAYHYKVLFGYSFWGTDFLADKLDIVYNGPFCVRFFFTLSAFLIASSFYQSASVEKIKLTVVKRYLRLSLPVLIVALIIWIMEQFGCFYNTSLGDMVTDTDILNSFQTPHSFLQVFTTSLCSTIFTGETSFNNNFWMMTIMFWGDLFAMILAVMTAPRKKINLVIWLFMAVVLLLLNSNYLPFLTGTAIAYWYTEKSSVLTEKKMLKTIAYIGLLLLGVFLVEVKGYINIWYEAWDIGAIEELKFLGNSNFYNTVAIVMILIAVMNLKLPQRILSFKPFIALGNISYYVFLIHWPMICSISCGLYLVFQDAASYPTVVRSIFTVTLVAVLMVATILTFTYDKFCGKFTNWVTKKMS